MDIQRKFLGSPINSQRCISSVLLGLHQESPKEVAELWELRAFSLWIWLKHFHKNGSLFIWHTAYPSGSWTAGPLKIYHPIKKGPSSNHHFFRGINSLWNFRGVYVNPSFPTPIFLCPDESATDSPKEWPASVASDQKWSEGSRAALWWPESSVRPGPNWCCISLP